MPRPQVADGELVELIRELLKERGEPFKTIPEEILNLNARKVNELCKFAELDKKEIEHLKRLKRQFKNRGYAREARARRKLETGLLLEVEQLLSPSVGDNEETDGGSDHVTDENLTTGLLLSPLVGDNEETDGGFVTWTDENLTADKKIFRKNLEKSNLTGEEKEELKQKRRRLLNMYYKRTSRALHKKSDSDEKLVSSDSTHIYRSRPCEQNKVPPPVPPLVPPTFPPLSEAEASCAIDLIFGKVPESVGNVLPESDADKDASKDIGSVWAGNILLKTIDDTYLSNILADNILLQHFPDLFK